MINLCLYLYSKGREGPISLQIMSTQSLYFFLKKMFLIFLKEIMIFGEIENHLEDQGVLNL